MLPIFFNTNLKKRDAKKKKSIYFSNTDLNKFMIISCYYDFLKLSSLLFPSVLPSMHYSSKAPFSI